ncbi:MAG: hypothetical protein Q9191_002762 [Dirinaria sp. TL-2023a]
MALAQYSLNWASNVCGAATSYFHSATLPFPGPKATVIQDVQIWDGEKVLDETSITIEGQTIAFIGEQKNPRNAKIVKGNGGFLMPGLIDTHVHVATVMAPATFDLWSYKHLKTLVNFGITTGFDMGSFPSSKMPQFHELGSKGLPSLLWSGAAACVSGGFPGMLPGFPKESIINSTQNATDYAEIRINEGVDYIKIFINDKGLPKQEYQEIIKSIADENNKLVISHAPSFVAHDVARSVGGKFITHVPKDKALNYTGVQEMRDNDQIAIPTLIMSQNLIRMLKIFDPQSPVDYSFANDSVALMQELGVPILVGTDASGPVGFVGYGESLHEELGLLYDAGVPTQDILRGATSLPAKYFNLADRGRIAKDLRADLLLLKKNPFDDITNSKTVSRVWTAGKQAYP